MSTKAAAATSADRWTRQIREELRAGGSAERAKGAQHFFQHAVVCRGWKTADLRKYSRDTRKQILAEGGQELLIGVADRLFTGEVNEETIGAVLMLEGKTAAFGDAEFALFERWMDRITNWAQHDGLVYCLVGPMLARDHRFAPAVMKWAKSKNRWKRRGAAVAFIPAAREGELFSESKTVTHALLADQDDMVQKGLGWLLREWAKAHPKTTVPFLMTIRKDSPRLVLRTACETLPPATRARVLRKPGT
jgi:3-methyladenine DNA glycosylase AlkD